MVSHGHGRLLAALLRDLAALERAPTLQVIVTLNLLDEPFDSSAFPHLRIDVIRNQRPKGFGANHNAAFAQKDEDAAWFAVLNPDLRLPEDPFAALLKFAGERPDCGLLAPRVLNPDGEPEDAVRGNLTVSSLVRRTLGQREAAEATGVATKGSPFYWLAGMFLFFRAEAYRKAEGFDERFFMYCEDYDLCARLYLDGSGLATVSDCFVIHDAQRRSHRSARFLGWHVRSLIRVWTSLPFWRVAIAGPRG